MWCYKQWATCYVLFLASKSFRYSVLMNFIAFWQIVCARVYDYFTFYIFLTCTNWNIYRHIAATNAPCTFSKRNDAEKRHLFFRVVIFSQFNPYRFHSFLGNWFFKAFVLALVNLSEIREIYTSLLKNNEKKKKQIPDVRCCFEKEMKPQAIYLIHKYYNFTDH